MFQIQFVTVAYDCKIRSMQNPAMMHFNLISNSTNNQLDGINRFLNGLPMCIRYQDKPGLGYNQLCINIPIVNIIAILINYHCHIYVIVINVTVKYHQYCLQMSAISLADTLMPAKNGCYGWFYYKLQILDNGPTKEGESTKDGF